MKYIDMFYNRVNKILSFLPSDAKFFKIIQVPALIFIFGVTAFCIFQWCTLIVAMKDPKNFKHEKTRTYNSMHGLPENKK
jgi:hypothetical protein